MPGDDHSARHERNDYRDLSYAERGHGEAGPSRPRGPYFMGEHANLSQHETPRTVPTSGRSGEYRSSRHGHDMSSEYSQPAYVEAPDAWHDRRSRPYVSPVSPDLPEEAVFSSNPVSFGSRTDYKSRRGRTRDDGMPHRSVLDATYGSTAYQVRPDSSKEVAAVDNGVGTHLPAQAVDYPPTSAVIGWNPSEDPVREDRPSESNARRRHRRNNARLQHILITAGRSHAQWPRLEEVEHIMHWTDETLIHCFRDHRWRPPQIGAAHGERHDPRDARPVTVPEAKMTPSTVHSSASARGLSRDGPIPDVYAHHPSSSHARRDLGIKYSRDGDFRQHQVAVPPPQTGLTPSYEMDPRMYHNRPVTSSSMASGREFAHTTSANFEVYAVDDAPRRARMLMSPDQQAALQALWRITRFPNLQQREECGEKVGLTNRQVQVWFQNQRQKARKQTAAGAEHAYSAELAQRGRPPTQDGNDSTSSSRPNSRGSDALGLSFEGGFREPKRDAVTVAAPASAQGPGSASPTKQPSTQQATPWAQMASLNPFDVPSAERDHQTALPSIRNILDDPSPLIMGSVLPPIRTSSSTHSHRSASGYAPAQVALAFGSTSAAPQLDARRPSLSQGSTPRQVVRQMYSPLIPAQRLSDRPEIKAGRRHSQPYIKTISTSTTSSMGLRLSPPSGGIQDKNRIGRDDGGWSGDLVIDEEEGRTPKADDDRQSISLQ